MIYCIPLSKQKIALVGKEDYLRFGHLKWSARQQANGTFYAGRREPGTRKPIYLHREILSATPKEIVDHRRGGDWTLDCRRENLRRCTKSQNGYNRGKTKLNKSGFKGVSWHQGHKMWFCRVQAEKRTAYFRYFPGTEEGKLAAASAYDVAAMELHGEFACLNFPR